MDFSQYKQLALRTESTRPIPSDPQRERIEHALIGMVTEVAEMADNLKKHMFYGKDIDRANMKEELGDVMRYIAIFCDATGITLEDAMKANIAKLQKRYPEGYTDYHAENRDTVEEMKAVMGENDFDVYGEKEMCVSDWLKLLPTIYEDRAMLNFLLEYKKDIACGLGGKLTASSMGEAIYDSFDWSSTIEGNDFRKEVVHHYYTKGKYPLPPLPNE